MIQPGNKLWNIGYVFVVELVFTFVFNLAIFHAKNSKLSLFHNGVTGAFSVIMGLYYGVKCAGGYSGAALNPSVAIANNIVYALFKKDNSAMKYLGAYIFGPIAGAALAAIFCKYVSEPIVTNQCGEQEEAIWKREQVKHFIKQTNLNFS